MFGAALYFTPISPHTAVTVRSHFSPVAGILIDIERKLGSRDKERSRADEAHGWWTAPSKKTRLQRLRDRDIRPRLENELSLHYNLEVNRHGLDRLMLLHPEERLYKLLPVQFHWSVIAGDITLDVAVTLKKH